MNILDAYQEIDQFISECPDLETNEAISMWSSDVYVDIYHSDHEAAIALLAIVDKLNKNDPKQNYCELIRKIQNYLNLI